MTTETSAIVATLTLAAGTAANPHLQEYLELARLTKAEGDVRVLAMTVVRLLMDVGSIRALDGRIPVRPELLVGDGSIPSAHVERIGWAQPLDGRAVQGFSAHLVDNAAAYPEGGRVAGNWRGPYVEHLSPDPWGNRYAANVLMLRHQGPGVTLVVSAGPDGLVETPFETVRLKPAGDDVVSLVWATH